MSHKEIEKCTATLADGRRCDTAGSRYTVTWPRWPAIWREETGVGNGRAALCSYHVQRLQRAGAAIERMDGQMAPAQQKASAPEKRRFRLARAPRAPRAPRRLEELTPEQLEKRRQDIERRARLLRGQK